MPNKSQAVDGRIVQSAGFTPGPWRTGLSDEWNVDGPGDHSSMHVLAGRGGHPVAIVCASHNSELRTAQLTANASLIASAPALYEALEWMVETFGDRNNYPKVIEASVAIHKARAALSAAEGKQTA